LEVFMRVFRVLSALALAFFSLSPAVGVAAPAAQAPTGMVYGWGYNADGQLGTGTTTNSLQPAAVAGLPDVLMVATGVTESVAIAADRTVWRWGNGGTQAIQMPGLDNVAAVSVGASHVLATRMDGTVWAWGRNDFGELGDGTTTTRSAPVQVKGLSNVQAIAAGNLFSLAVTNDGQVWSWGYNIYGQLGNGTTNSNGTPTPVPGLSGVFDVAAGAHFSLAMKADGTVWAWGRNDQGQLGNGTSRPTGAGSTRPVQVTGLSGVRWISAGSEFALVAMQDGSVWAWGSNSRGQLGNGRSGDISTNAIQVPGVGGVAMVAAGAEHSLALLGDGSVAAWGSNFWGELGTGSRSTQGCWCIASPSTSALGGLGWVAAGRQHSLAMQVVNAGDANGAAPTNPVAAEEPQPPEPTAANGTSPGGDPPLGQYGCITFYSGNYAGDLVLLGGGAYIWYDEPGSYVYDAGTGAFAWQSGPVANLGYGGEFRAAGSPHPSGPGYTYGADTIVLTGVAGSQAGDLISCEYEG
jgi:alpha-tubulin suppressor-like RCC1 family protein